jgi:hypothetical protein
MREGAIDVAAEDENGNAVEGDVVVDGEAVGRTPGLFKVSVCASALSIRHPTAGTFFERLSIEEHQVLAIKAGLRLTKQQALEPARQVQREPSCPELWRRRFALVDTPNDGCPEDLTQIPWLRLFGWGGAGVGYCSVNGGFDEPCFDLAATAILGPLRATVDIFGPVSDSSTKWDGVGGSLGVDLLSYPRLDGNTFSPVNFSVALGGAKSLNESAVQFGPLLYIELADRVHISPYGFLGFVYRHALYSVNRTGFQQVLVSVAGGFGWLRLDGEDPSD